MKIDDQLIEHLASLSKLEFDKTAKANIKQDLQKILGFFEQISTLDTGDVEPLIHISQEVNVFRADEVQQLITREEALQNAPVTDGRYIKVPKVIKKK